MFRRLIDLLASNVPAVKEYQITRELDSAYKRAVAATNPDERVELSTRALDIIATLKWSGRTYWEGILALMRGQGYMDLRSRSNIHYLHLARKDFESAASLLSPGSGQAWGHVMNWLSITYAESTDWDCTTAISKAIEASEAAVTAFSWEKHGSDRAEAQCNLAGYYLQRSTSGGADDQRKAIELLDDVLDHTRKRGQEREQAIAQAVLSNVYRERFEGKPEENIERAIQLAESALPHFERMMPAEQFAGFLMNLANCYRNRPKDDPMQNRQKAEQLLRKSLNLLESPAYRAQRASVEMNLGGLLASVGDVCTAISLFESAASVFTANDYPAEYAKVQINLSHASAYWRLGTSEENVERSIAEARAGADSTSRTQDKILWAKSRVALANALSLRRGANRVQDLNETIGLIEAALECLSPETTLDEWCSAKNNLANAIAERASVLRKANLETAIAIRRDVVRDNLETAIAIQREVLERTNPRVWPTDWSQGHRNLALSYLERRTGSRADNVERAIALSELGLVALKPYAHPAQRSELLETLGDALSRRTRGTRVANAEDAYQAYDSAWQNRNRDANPDAWFPLRQKRSDALSIFLSLGGKDRSSTEDAQGESPHRLEVEEFIDALKKAAEAVSFEEHPQVWIRAQEDLAQTLILTVEPGSGCVEYLTANQQPRIESAISIYETVQAKVPRSADPEQWASTRISIGNAYSQLHLLEDFPHRGVEGLKDRSLPALPNRSPRAMGYLAAATAAYADAEQVIRNADRTADHIGLCLRLGQAHLWRRDWLSASDAFEAAGESAALLLSNIEASETEFLLLLRSLGDLSVDGPFAAAMAGDNIRAVRLFEVGRARVLTKSLALAATYAPLELRTEAHAILVDIRENERRLAKSNLFERSTPLEESIRLRKRYGELLSQVSLDDAVNNVDGYSRLREVTCEGQVSVLPLFTSCGGCLLIAQVSEGDICFSTEPCTDEITLKQIYQGSERDGFPSWVEGYRAVNRRRVPVARFLDWGRTIEATASHLGEFAMKSLFSYCGPTHGGVTRLNLFPQSAVGLLPITAVPDRESGALVIDRFAVSLCPSVSTLARARQRFGSRVTATIATIRDAGDDIPSTQFETTFVASWFNADARAMVTTEMSKAELINTIRGRDCWHFACHGYFDSKQPTKSGLHLHREAQADEVLTLEDLLDAEPLGSPELVVLSACSSGLYGTEDLPNEFLGLASGFLQLGARSVIASLWPVKDTSTAFLIAYFYQRHFEDGMDACRALRSAQLWLRDANANDLRKQLNQWRASGHVSKDEEGSLTRQLNRDVREIQPADGRPYSSPAFWAPFVHFGA